MTADEQAILDALSAYTLRSGSQLCDLANLSVAKLYPALMRLERDGLIQSEWEDAPPPRRRRYRLTEPDAQSEGQQQ